TPSNSMRIRFPDKSPVTPNSVKSAFENEFELDEFSTCSSSTANLSTSKVSFGGRIKARQTNSNTLPSLSSIDENGVNEEIEYSFEKIKNSTTSEPLRRQSGQQTNQENDCQVKSIRVNFRPKK